MIRAVKRVGAALPFALFGCDHASACPIDVCEGDTRPDALRLAVWVGPAVVFGASAFIFGGRQRHLAAWAVLLAGLVATHAITMTAAR